MVGWLNVEYNTMKKVGYKQRCKSLGNVVKQRKAACVCKAGTGLVWFKHDLRVQDHPGLLMAAQRPGNNICVYIFDVECVSSTDSEKDLHFLHSTLSSLKKDLIDLGTDLIVKIGSSDRVLAELVEKYQIETIVTEKEVNYLWLEKLDALKQNLTCTIDLWSNNLFDCEQYPSVFSELQNCHVSYPRPAPQTLKCNQDFIAGHEFPALSDFVGAMQSKIESAKPELQSTIKRITSQNLASCYCGDEMASSSANWHDADLEEYLAFPSSAATPLQRQARSLEVAGGEGQSFNVLLRKKLQYGVFSTRYLHREAQNYRWNNILSLNRDTLKGANAALEAAIKYDFAKNLHTSLDKDSFLAFGEHRSWQWRGVLSDFVTAEPHGVPTQPLPPIVLVHGFGAFGSHWRDNIAGLASKGYRVFCPTLPGYGRSEKASAQYTPELWSNYIRDFIINVVKEPAIIAGNSIGGYICAQTSANSPDLIKGLVLVNTAGRLQAKLDTPPGDGTKASVPKLSAEISSRLIFWLLERSVPRLLKQAYPIVPSRADADLATEIKRASSDPGAFGVFKSVFYLPKPVPLNHHLDKYKGPTLVFQGQKDPLNDAPSRAKQMSDLCPDINVVLVEAGHCPHDEIPNVFNTEMDKFANSILASETKVISV